jgi:predicted DNA-binding transcriptional regulator YafY
MTARGGGLTAGMNDHDARLLRRETLLALLRTRRAVRVTKDLAHSLGVTRKRLTAEIQCLIDTAEPVRWQSRRVAVRGGAHAYLGLDLTDDELLTLIAALRHTREAAHTRMQVAEASHLLHRIGASLPLSHFAKLSAIGQFDVLPSVMSETGYPSTPHRNLVVQAIRAQRKLRFLYTASDGARTERVIWPLTLTYHDACVVGWCETRSAFRTFRISSIAAPDMTDLPFPRSRDALMTEWRKTVPARNEVS